MAKYLQMPLGRVVDYFLNKKKRMLVKDYISNQSIFTKDLVKGNNIKIGDFTYGEVEVLQWSDNQTLTIGKYCSFARGIKVFLGGNHRSDWVTTYPFDKILKNGQFQVDSSTSKGNVIIENDVWIGEDVKILSGIKISNGAVIGTGSVVTKNIPPYAIVVGNPGRVVKFRFEQEVIDSLLQINWWNWSDDKVKNNLNDLLCEDLQNFIKKHLKVNDEY
jgi:acetyltransferase-like isoleucine patch superfamily enzyme